MLSYFCAWEVCDQFVCDGLIRMRLFVCSSDEEWEGVGVTSLQGRLTQTHGFPDTSALSPAPAPLHTLHTLHTRSLNILELCFLDFHTGKNWLHLPQANWTEKLRIPFPVVQTCRQLFTVTVISLIMYFVLSSCSWGLFLATFCIALYAFL